MKWHYYLLAAAAMVSAIAIAEAVDLYNQDGYILLTENSADNWSINFNTSKTTGGGNLTLSSNGTAGFIPYVNGVDSLIAGNSSFATNGNLLLSRNLLLRDYGSDGSILFNSGNSGGMYWVRSTDRIRYACNAAGTGTCEFFGGSLYFAGSANPSLSLYSDSADRTLTVANTGAFGANLVVDNNITSTSGIVSAPEICLNGDCRTIWPSLTLPPPVKFINVVAGAVTDTNQPVATRAFANSYYMVISNLTEYTQFRFGVARAATAGAAGSIVWPKYRNGTCNTLTVGSWADLESSGPTTLSTTTANQATATGYLTLADGAKDNVCLAFFTSGGDGVLDPQFRNIWLEFK